MDFCRNAETCIFGLLLPVVMVAQHAESRKWTLQDCIDYALVHNVTLAKSRTSEQSAVIDVVEAKAGRFPALTASVSQALTYRPFQSSGGNYVNGNIATSAADKTMQSGNYGVNAQWVVWNGGKTKMNIANANYALQLAAYDTQTAANTIKEQITQLYIQILYMTEAEKVNSTLLRQDSVICSRGQEMVRVGSMAQADLAQLEAQVSQGHYDVVNIQTQIADAKMQLKQLIELPATEVFDISPIEVAEAQIMSNIPAKEYVFEAAFNSRPEIKRSTLAIEQSKLSTRIAKSAYYPTVSLTGAVNDSHVTGGNQNYFSQMKNNFSTQLGVSVSIPIFDNRKNKSAVERAKVAETTAQLNLQDTQKQLYQAVETYWLNATNSQAKYVAARQNVASLEKSYELMTEQFNLGLKNIAELLTSRSNLLTARQQMLQDKYTALLNRNLLDFYAGRVLQ